MFGPSYLLGGAMSSCGGAMSSELPAWFSQAFSVPRLAPYLRAANGDVAVAERLYWWNVEISGAFYGSLHCLEVTLRNALHGQLRTKYGRADWWVSVPLNSNGLRVVEEARQKCGRRQTGTTSADDIVAQLSFSFWVSLLSAGNSYDRILWVPALHRAFPYYSGRRRNLHDNLVTMVLFRNRIMHHEPVHHRDLAADHRKLYRLLGYLSPDSAKQAQTLDRAPAVLARRRDVCAGVKPASF
jgi:hypothetical protein